MIDFSDCTLEPLQRDGELVLYRGAHARSASDVGPRMPLLAPARDYASPATLARLEHEYSLAAELDPRWAVRPVKLERYRGRAVLVLEDPGGEPLARLLGTPIEVGTFLRLAISIAGAVG